jgi:hypothetical protein
VTSETEALGTAVEGHKPSHADLRRRVSGATLVDFAVNASAEWGWRRWAAATDGCWSALALREVCPLSVPAIFSPLMALSANVRWLGVEVSP